MTLASWIQRGKSPKSNPKRKHGKRKQKVRKIKFFFWSCCISSSKFSSFSQSQTNYPHETVSINLSITQHLSELRKVILPKWSSRIHSLFLFLFKSSSSKRGNWHHLTRKNPPVDHSSQPKVSLTRFEHFWGCWKSLFDPPLKDWYIFLRSE